MTEWWTYRPDDFLLYSARTWYRLFEVTHAGAWPAQVVGGAAGLALVGFALRGAGTPSATHDSRGRRMSCVVLAAAWAWVAWAFHLERYATIHWAAPAFAAAFGVQSVVMLGGAWSDTGSHRAPLCPISASIGAAAVVFAVLGYPLLAPLAGRPWLQAEVFALMPDPTALATLGWLLLTPVAPGAPAWRRWLSAARWPMPLAWCGWSAMMLAVMGSPEAWVLAGATALSVVAGGLNIARRCRRTD